VKGVEPESDDVLTRRTAAGDRDAFATLYRRHQRTVFRFARQMSGSDATAEDVTQEVFLILMRQIGRYDPQRASLPTLLYGIARNVILQRLARTRPTLTIDEIESTHDEPAVESDALGAIQREEIVRRVRRAILDLPEPFREVVVLADLHGLSYAEVAAVLECPHGTVRSRLYRRRLLAERLRISAGADRSSSVIRCLL
jgi:RNA polymerase sigma-70 factor, ECF subfamily